MGNAVKVKKFLVVYSDEYNNKESYFTDNIMEAIRQIQSDHEIPRVDCDEEKLASDDPYQIGTFDIGFYDIDCYDDEMEYKGAIFIFDLAGAIMQTAEVNEVKENG